MNVDKILKNNRKLNIIKEVASKYGIKVSSAAILSICILLSSGSSYNAKNQTSKIMPKQREVTTESFMTSRLKFIELSFEDKINRILSLYDITKEELDICCAIVCAEAGSDGTNYEEAKNVVNTAYNRIISRKWVASFGDNIYNQLTALNQFVVYQNGSYKRFLGRTDLNGYQAVIDFLSNTAGEDYHNYLSFRANNITVDGSVMLVDGGNNYFSVLSDEDRLEDFRVEQGSVGLILEK